MQKHYDYIIAGAGAAGLSLAWRMINSPLSPKKILIIDSDLSPSNDKTWCFWEAGSPPFQDLIHKEWNRVEVGVDNTRFTESLRHYPYYCLRSGDFQQKILSTLDAQPNVDLHEAEISDFSSSSDRAVVNLESNENFSAEYIFQSCLSPWNSDQDQPDYPLLQHFLGWEIELANPLFDANTFTLMDFDETFDEGIAFIYLLPWTDTSGLIEYTIFSDEVLSKNYYEEKISLYLNHRFGLKRIDYQINRREFGKIPMMDRPVKPWLANRVMNIGTVGGITKPSTGYTFRRIQSQVDDIMSGLLSDGVPAYAAPSMSRYKAYDLWLLQIIHDHPREALDVFQHLFRNNTVDELFRFLGEETSLRQDLKIMSSVPYPPFLRAIWQTRQRLLEI